jgi:GT2 family glycosyltransferase
LNIPSVGVVVVNWNSFDELQRCLAALASVRGQIRRTVVIDNFSRCAPDELPHPRPDNTEYVRLDSNTGFARGNNLALPYLEDCDWIALVNPDAYVDAGWLESMLDAVDRHPDYAMFASCLLKANTPSILDGAGDSYNLSGLAWRMGYGVACQAFTVRESEVFAPCAAAALYRRDVLVALGGFDEDFFCYFEDVDLAFRFRLAGYRCMLVGNAIAHHEGSKTTGGQHSDFSVYHGHRNLVWTFVKDMPGILFWLLLPLHVLLNVVAVMHFSVRGQGKVILRAKYDAIKGLPRMWRKRRDIQAKRKTTVAEIWRVLDKCLWPVRR